MYDASINLIKREECGLYCQYLHCILIWAMLFMTFHIWFYSFIIYSKRAEFLLEKS